jgi:hypothetical protein
MAKKKKNKSPVAILERAEALFSKKSYQAALQEYKKLDRDCIEAAAAHIKICEQKTVASRVRELLKKARRLLNKNNSEEALRCFEQAYTLSPDSELADTIAALLAETGDRNQMASAEQAEADGEYLKAAEIFGRLNADSSPPATPANNELLCRQARCFLLADQPRQATDVYAKIDTAIDLLSPADLYNAGFALAQSGRFADCLSYWQDIQSTHPRFLAQKDAVQARFIQELASRLTECFTEGIAGNRAEDPTDRAAEVWRQLKVLPDSGVHIEQLPGGKELAARCRSLRLARLWREGRVREITEMSGEVNFLNPSVLEVQAKAAYQVIQAEGAHASPVEVRHFIDCWLSALFHPAIVSTLPGEKAEAEQHRRVLLDIGIKLVRNYTEQQEKGGDQLIQQWEEDFALLKTLIKLAVAEEQEENTAPPLYTPALAHQAGIAERLFAFVRKNQDQFADNERFIAAGAAYSPAASSMLMVRNGQYTEALNELVHLEHVGNREKSRADPCVDPFVAYGTAKVKMECGLHYLNIEQYRDAEKILTGVIPSASQSTSLERQLLAVLDRSDKHYDADYLAVSVNLLTRLHQKKQKTAASDAVNSALCSVLTRQAVSLHNEEKIHSKVLLKSMKKAVALNPDDEFARMTLDDASVELEIIEMRQAVNFGKLAKAARIAKNSQYQRVVDQFFEFSAQVIDQVEAEDCPDKETGVFMLRQLLHNVLLVDPDHEIIQDIEFALNDPDMDKALEVE